MHGGCRIIPHVCCFVVALATGTFAAAAAPATQAATRPATQPATIALLAERALRQAHPALCTAIEQGLGARPDTRLLDREHVDRVLDEQPLAAVLSPAGGEQRVKLGQLLRADLLVALRGGGGGSGGVVGRDGEKSASLSLVVCETGRGLRLITLAFPATGDLAKDAADVLALVASALAKHGEGVAHVCAVPPLVSQDLVHTYRPLQRAYATVIEQALLARPGVVVVELEEAHSIAREIELAGGPGVARPLPLYFLGEFRNTGDGDARRVRVQLIARRGETEVSRIEKQDSPPGDVATILRDAAVRALGNPADGAVEPADPLVESKQLAERAKLHQRLGNHTEALDLIEASLLLEPKQPRLHYDAVNILRRLQTSLPGERTWTEVFDVRGDQVLDAFEREIGHLERYLRMAEVGAEAGVGEINFLARTGHSENVFLAARLKPRALALDRRKREMLFEVFDEKKRRGEHTFARRGVIERSFAFAIEGPDENRTVRLRVLRLFAGLPGNSQYRVETILGTPLFPSQSAPEYEALLEAAASATDDAETRRHVEALRATYAWHRQPAASPVAATGYAAATRPVGSTQPAAA
ncbi:MAG: hypothetical protein M3478_12215, partial [Planctomycetota bacterium]|nr:hypothetical protein [Planctomycetota bacterium]